MVPGTARSNEVAQRVPILRLPAWSTCLLPELLVEIPEDLTE
jgi:hypothetical protein